MKRFLHIVLCQILILIAWSSGIYAQSSPDSINYLTSISEELDAPLRIAVDRMGITYVADALSHSILKYDDSGNFLEAIHVVEQAISVAINNEDQLFIGDGESGYIYRYDPLSGASEFFTETLYPSSMEFGHDNILYVSDSKLQQVIALDLSANVVQTMGSGILDFPTGIAVDNNNKRILVGEHGGAGTGFSPTVKVYMFDFEGNYIKSFGSHGSSDGKFYRIQGLTVGKCGNIYVVDPFQARISVFDEDGVFITKFGDFGLQSGELNIPMDIVFDSRERLWISSMNNGALELFSISDTLPSSNMKCNNRMICEGESTNIDILFTGTAPWSFTYTVDGVNPTVVNTSDNPHFLTVSDAGYYEIVALSDANYDGTCFTGSAEVVVTSTAPTAQMSGDAVICDGDTTELFVDFTGSAPWSFTYTIDGLNPVSEVTVNNPHIIEVIETGVYELTSLSGGGCAGAGISGAATITVNPLPSAEMTDGNIQIFLYPGESAVLPVELTGSSPWEITYTVDDLNPTTIIDINESSYELITAETGSYEIKEVSDALCVSNNTLGYPDVQFYSSPPAPTSQIDEGELFICPGEYVPIQVYLTGAAPWTITFSVDNTPTTVNDIQASPYIINAIYEGVYEVVALTDMYGEGTEFSGSAQVSYNPLPVSNFSYTAEYLELSLFSLSENADFFYWDFGDGIISAEENPVHKYNSSGVYQVSLSTASELCTGSTLSRTITLTATPVIDTTEPSIKIYPNPSSGMVTIELEDITSEALLEVISLKGSILYSEIFPEGLSIKELDLSYLKPTLYFVKITTQDQIITKKLIINNSKH